MELTTLPYKTGGIQNGKYLCSVNDVQSGFGWRVARN